MERGKPTGMMNKVGVTYYSSLLDKISIYPLWSRVGGVQEFSVGMQNSETRIIISHICNIYVCEMDI